jgi:hypothetical protein
MREARRLGFKGSACGGDRPGKEIGAVFVYPKINYPRYPTILDYSTSKVDEGSSS